MAKDAEFSLDDLDANLDLVVTGIKGASAALGLKQGGNPAPDFATASKSLADICEPLELLVAELAKLSESAGGQQAGAGAGAADVAGGNCRVIVIK